MNCPSCNSRNPSGAKRCLHCGITFETQDAGLLGLVADSEGDVNWGYIFVGVIVAFFVIVMAVKGFDTVKVECTTSDAEASKYEASPEWARDTSAERARWDEVESRDRELDLQERQRNEAKLENLKCYRKTTGHVKGIAD